MAMRLPMHREGAVRAALLEGLKTHLLIILGSRRLPRHHPARKDDGAVIGAGGPRQGDQRVLAGAARTDHQDQPARADRGLQVIRYGWGFAHAPPWPSSQTAGTTVAWRAARTRIRSA